MQKKFISKQAIIKECTESNDDFRRLFLIFRLTLRPGMSYREFTFYYRSKNLEYIDATFLYDQDLIIGFCAAAFYSTGKKSTIGRSATGLNEDYQGKALPKWTLYKKYIRYKVANPLKQIVLTAYVANPLIYSMICKYTGIVYPRFTVEVPDKLTKIKNDVLIASGLQKREKRPFVVQIHFDVHKGEKLKQRISESTNVHVQFFIRQTGLQQQTTLLVIIPVSWLNIIFTTAFFIKHYSAKLYFILAGLFLLILSKKRNKCMETFKSVNTFFKKTLNPAEYGN